MVVTGWRLPGIVNTVKDEALWSDESLPMSHAVDVLAYSLANNRYTAIRRAWEIDNRGVPSIYPYIIRQ